MMRKVWLAFGVAVLVAGCAAPVIRYYSLTSPAAEPAPAATVSRAAYGLRLRVSEVPAEVNRIQLVVHDPASEPAVQVLNQSLWAASLRDQIQEQLSAATASVLGVPDLNRVPSPAGMPVRAVTVHVTRFDLVWAKRAVLEANWTDHRPGTKAARLCRAGISVPAGTGVAALVDGQRKALQMLARVVADSGSESVSPANPEIQYSGCTW